MRNLGILEVVTNSTSVKIGFLKYMIKIFEKYLRRSFFSKDTGNGPKILQKILLNVATLQNCYFKKHLF